MKDYVPPEDMSLSEAEDILEAAGPKEIESVATDDTPDSDLDLDLEVKVPERVERVPEVRSTVPGKVNRTLEGLGERYKTLFPDRDCRWVYSPQHRPELSNVIARKAEGYRKVKTEEIDMDLEDLESGDNVRVGDVILMSIPREEREGLIAERQEIADEQTRSTERSYYEESEAMFAEARTQGDESSGRPKGRSKTEVRTLEYDVNQDKE